MKKILYSLVLLAATTFFSSCDKEFLDTAPTDAIGEKDAFTTADNALAALNGIHRSMYFQYSSQNQCGQGSVNIFSDMLGEDLVMTSAGNGWFNTAYRWESHTNVNSADIYFIYRFYYKNIANCNMIIANIDNAVGTSAKKKMIKGQAFTYRAWAHFMLVQLFAARYDATTVPNTQLGVPIMIKNSTAGLPRATVEEVYAQINTDLDSAMNNLVGYTRANKSHLNLSVAQGIKARVALTMQDWPTAATYAALARTGYTLMSNAQYTAGFNDYTNPEWMWGSTVISDQTTYFYSFFAYMSYNFSSTNIRGNPKAINSLLYNQIPATDVRKGLWIVAPTATNPAIPSAFTRKPYMNVKFKAAGEADSRGDVVYMRAAEMYLIEAEALARQGGQDAAAAAALFTLVKNRNAAYTLSTNTGQALIDEILLQRRIELWGEGFRFLDLKRLNQSVDRTGSNHTAALALYLTIPAGGNNWQFYIPKAEMDANPALVGQQNP